MIQESIHKNIVANCERVVEWFEKNLQGLQFPVFSSFDIRDSGQKLAPVDANIFPAGFNNICPTDQENAPVLVANYMKAHYPELKGARIGILAEEHNIHSFYWENVATLTEIFKAAGYPTEVFVPAAIGEPREITTPKNMKVVVSGAENREGYTFVGGQRLDFVICNNDFSVRPESWSGPMQTAMNPPLELGWYQRRKNRYFEQYNTIVREFAEIVGVASAHLQVKTEVFSEFDVFDSHSMDRLAKSVDHFLADLKTGYQQEGIHHDAFCFIKSNMGTYGMGVAQVHSGDEVLNWNSKIRNKMKSAKGGQKVDSVVLQEGILTRFKDEEGATAEPCIYLIGKDLVGGFLRTHAQKSDEENLNSPGAVFKRLCISDLEVDMPGCPMENVYGWISKLSALALAREARAANVSFKGYKN